MKAKLFFLFSIVFTLVLMSSKWFTVPLVEANVENCIQFNGEDGCQRPTHTPTPTPTPTETQPQPPPSNTGGPGDGRSDGAHGPAYVPETCTGPIPDKPVLNRFKVINSTTDEYGWEPVKGADKYSVVYGYKPDMLVYGIPELPPSTSSVQIGGLKPNTQSWAQVWAWIGPCASFSNIFN
jgi:hypothetical protein